MIRLMRALSWMRWRSFVNGLSRGRKRSRGQRFSRWLEASASAILLAFGLLMSLGLAAGALLAGLSLARSPELQAPVFLCARVFVLGAFAMTLIAPLQGSHQSPVRLLLLPVSRRQLTLATLLSSLGDPSVVLVAPAALMLGVGLLCGGAMRAGAVALVAGAALIAVLAGVDAIVDMGVQLLLRDRRRGEITALVAMLLLMTVGFLPALVASRVAKVDDLEKDRDERRAAIVSRIQDLDREMGPIDWLPPGQHARAVERALDGRLGASLAHATGLVLAALGATLAAVAMHARLMSEPGRTSRRGRAARFPARAIAWLPLGVSAVAAATARSAMRTVRGKIVTFTPPLVAAVLSVLVMRMNDVASLFGITVVSSAGIFSLAFAMSVLNQQPFLLNAFASEGAGFTLTALMPVGERQIVRGKMLGLGLLLLVALALSAVVAAVVGEPAPLAAWAATALGCLATWLLYAPVALVLSAQLPKEADMSKLAGQQPHGLAMLAGMLAFVAAMAGPRLLAALGRLTLGPWGGALGALGARAVGAVSALAFRELASRTLLARREAIAMAAQGR